MNYDDDGILFNCLYLFVLNKFQYPYPDYLIIELKKFSSKLGRFKGVEPP